MSTTTDDTHLDVLMPDSLDEIASVAAEPCVSILMPTHRKGRETQQGAIRLEDLRNQASEQLDQSGYDQRILERIAGKPDDNEFWQHQGEGLAIFLSPEVCRMFRLNRQVDEIGETDALPAKFNDLVLPRDPEESLQNTSHRSAGNSAGASTAMFHGQGEGKIEADRKQYLPLVGDEVANAVYSTGMLLVVVATSGVRGHFKATKKVTIDAQVTGSPEHMSADQIRERAYEAIAPRLQSDHDEFAERFGSALAKRW